MKFLYGFVILLFLGSCGSSGKTTFARKGVSFQCPSGWSITEEDSLEGAGYYLSAEKEGFNESGLWSITWVEREGVSAEDFLASMRESLSGNIIYENSNLKMSAPFKTHYANNTAVASSYTCKILGIEQEGVIYSFYGVGKVICILKQGALEDKEKNDDGFSFIESKFLNKVE